MPAFLLFEPLLQRLHELFPAAERFDQLLLFIRQVILRELFQPLFGNQRRRALRQIGDASEVRAEHAVEFVVVRLVLDKARARQIVEIVDAPANHALVERFEQRQEFPDRNRQAALFEFQEKFD